MRFSRTTMSVLEVKKYDSCREEKFFFAMDLLSRLGRPEERDEYFSRWPSPISVGGPVLQWLKSCYILGAFTAAATTATTTVVVVLYGHAVVFPSVFLYVPFTLFTPFYSFFFSLSFLQSLPRFPFSRASRTQPGKFYLGNRRSSSSASDVAVSARRKDGERESAREHGKFLSLSITSYCPSGPKFYEKRRERTVLRAAHNARLNFSAVDFRWFTFLDKRTRGRLCSRFKKKKKKEPNYRSVEKLPSHMLLPRIILFSFLFAKLNCN